jgi:hypothetical protein
MPTLLRNANGTLATRGGILQAIPDGGTAADCLCCGPPPCAFCPDDGGPYSSATLSVTVAGFPATFVYITTGFDGLGQPLRIRRTIEGLDAANGTYALTWNPETCQFVSPFGKTLPLTITTEAWRQGPGDPPDVCAFTQAAPGSSTIEDSFLNVTPSGYSVAGGWLTLGLPGATIVDPGGFYDLALLANGCESAGGSATYTIAACSTSASFTYTATVTFAGIT